MGLFTDFVDWATGNDDNAEKEREEARKREEARRQREYEAEQAAHNRYQREREDQRRDARLREEAAEKRQMEREKELREERRREQEAAEKRRQEAEREQHARKREAERLADERFREQRDFNQAELKEKTSEHKNLMTKKEKEKADTETKFEERAVKLEKERKEEQEKYHQDKNEFDEKRSKASLHHHAEIEKQLRRNYDIEAKMNEDAHDHEQRMVAANKNFKFVQVNQSIAEEQDSLENHFIDSVNNTRTSGRDVVDSINSLANYAYSLREGISAPKKEIDMLKLAIARTQENIQTLNYSVHSFLEQTGKSDEEIVKYQEVARKIEEATSNLANSIFAFKGSLRDNPIKDSPTLFKEVSKNSAELRKHLNSFPTLSRSNHKIGVIYQSIQSISGSSGVAYLGSSGSRPAVEDQSSK